MPQKLRMVEHMWRVAYADGHLGDHERHVLWRVADLLHVPQGPTPTRACAPSKPHPARDELPAPARRAVRSVATPASKG